MPIVVTVQNAVGWSCGQDLTKRRSERIRKIQTSTYLAAPRSDNIFQNFDVHGNFGSNVEDFLVEELPTDSSGAAKCIR